MRAMTRLAPVSLFASLFAVTLLLGYGTSEARGAATKPAQEISVTTYHYNNARTGANLHETILTPKNVNSAHFGKIAFFPADGKVDAEPLYVANLKVKGKLHNVLYVVTEHDTIYAFDANSGVKLWQRSMLDDGETPSDDHHCNQVSPEIGITSTPVIDRLDGKDGAIFLVAMSKDKNGHYHQRLHALDLVTGKDLKGSPVEIQASYPGTGETSHNGRVVFDPGQYEERAGLLLLDGTIYTGWASHCDAQPYGGWLIPYNEVTLAQKPVLSLTPNGSEGSIWMSGDGMAADSSGNIYFLDANGTFDTKLNAQGFPDRGDYGNGFLKVSTTGGKLKVSDYFEPYNTIEQSDHDLDLGSGGAILLPDLKNRAGKTEQLAVGTGKDTNVYIVNRNDMGKFNPKSNKAIYEELHHVLPHGEFATPAYFNHTIYYGGVSAPLQAFRIVDAKVLPKASAATKQVFVYPGTTPSISADGNSNGIVWAIENTKPAVLYAFNPTTLAVLYSSNQAPNGRDHFGPGNKFITPMIANGKVYVGTQTGVAVFGLRH